MTAYETLRIIRGLPRPEERTPCALAIGNFDGTHLGHQALFQTVVSEARARGLLPSVLTFEPHPREFFGDTSIRRISTLRDRYRTILACGIERICVLPFNKALAELSPREFAEKILVDGLDAKWVAVGKNFYFGFKGMGSGDTLERLGKELHFDVHLQPLFSIDGQIACSSRIREALALGDLKTATQLLGHPYCITGRVVHGAQLGRKLGFPTLNIDILPPGSVSKPALQGVFAVAIRNLDESGKTYGGVASLGVKPTVTADARWLLEVNVFDWTGNAYGKMVEITFLEKLRDEKKFDNLAALKEAISQDALCARNLFSQASYNQLFTVN